MLYFYYVELCFSYVLVKTAYLITILSAKLHSPGYVNLCYVEAMPNLFKNYIVFKYPF